jgi:hypothetical protein
LPQKNASDRQHQQEIRRLLRSLIGGISQESFTCSPIASMFPIFSP